MLSSSRGSFGLLLLFVSLPVSRPMLKKGNAGYAFVFQGVFMDHPFF
jgi:hypothetical protein